MHNSFIRAAFLSGLALVANASSAADLSVTVENIGDAKGQIMVGVFDSAATFPQKIAVGKAVPAAGRDANGSLTVRFDGLGEGPYAVSVIHDRDEDRQLSTNLVGIPNEPYGFTGPVTRFGPPRFEDVAFRIPPGGTAVKVTLR